MNYDRITYFIKAAETMNFSEAARALYITPQAFGRQIALLEEELGTPLFVRTKHKVSLTYEGEIIYKHMAPLVETMESEYRNMQVMASKRSGKINIGILSFLSRAKVISPVLASVYSGSSNIDINTQMYEMREIMNAMDSGEIDLGITMTHEGLEASGDYDMITLDQQQAVIVVSLYHKWVVQDKVTLDDLKEVDRIRFQVEHDRPNNPYINYPCKNDIIVENYANMLSEIEKGRGYVIVSPEISEQSLSYKTKVIELPGEPLKINLTLLHKKTEERPAVVEIISRILDVFEL